MPPENADDAAQIAQHNRQLDVPKPGVSDTAVLSSGFEPSCGRLRALWVECISRVSLRLTFAVALFLVQVVHCRLFIDTYVPQAIMPNRRGTRYHVGGIRRRAGFELPSDDIEGWLSTLRKKDPSVSCNPQGPSNSSSSRSEGRILPPLGAACSHLGDSGRQADVTPTSGKRKRHDMTVVRRVDKAAMEPVQNLMTRGAQARQELVNDLIVDMYACSSRGPRDSELNTWTQHHALWYGNDSRPSPLDEHISALFKAGGYKSFKNYLSRAKEHHLMLGYPWTDRLDLIARKCSRSVLRGLAGATRSEPFDLCRVVGCLSCDDGPFHPEGPVHIRALISCSTMYLLREVEASAIDIADGAMSDNAVSLNLPISKVDWKAKGCTRTWSCVCDTPLPCPFHILEDHLVRLESFYGRLKIEVDPGLPLFPDVRGGYCTKNGVTSSLRSAIEKAGMSATAKDGTWCVSGHS